jgi:hypothetical protein
MEGYTNVEIADLLKKSDRSIRRAMEDVRAKAEREGLKV